MVTGWYASGPHRSSQRFTDAAGRAMFAGRCRKYPQKDHAVPAPQTRSDELTADQLAHEMANANRAYYDGVPVMTDDEFDTCKDMLRAMDPAHPLLQTVGAPVNPTSALQKAKHLIPMGSLDNAFDEKAIGLFLQRVDKGLVDAGAAPAPVFVLQPKMDGFSIDLCYEKGQLVLALTRGDGIEGEDVTHNMLRAKGVPRSLAERIDLSVRGEVVIHRDDFAAHFPGDSNTRSSAAGTARRLDGEKAQHLQFYAFSAVNHDGTSPATTEQKLIARLKLLGFRTAPSELVGAATPAELSEVVLALWQRWDTERRALPYECDGVVLKVSNIGKSLALGTSGGCPRGQLAMKWRGSMTATAQVVGLENSVGRTGAITPVAIFRSVECGGVNISRASLANWDEVARLGVGQGATVTVERAGEVIPKVTKVLKAGEYGVFQRPEKCPACMEPTTADGPRQMCRNPECSGQTFRKVYHWVQQRAIMHLGEAAVDALVFLSGPVQRAADLYTVDPSDLHKACGGAIMGRKVAASLEASRDVKLHELLGSIGVPGLGTTDALKLCRGLNLKAVSEHRDPSGTGGRYVFTPDGYPKFSPDDIATIPGFAAEKAEKVHRGLFAWSTDIIALAKHLRVTPPPAPGKGTGPLAGKKFCITGPTTINREALKKILMDAGGEWHSSVVRGLDYLVMAEADSQSTKAREAAKKGVTTISEAAILDLAGFVG